MMSGLLNGLELFYSQNDNEGRWFDGVLIVHRCVYNMYILQTFRTASNEQVVDHEISWAKMF